MALSQRYSHILLSFLFFLLPFLAVLQSASGQEIGFHDAPCTGNTMEFYVMASSQLTDLSWSVSGAGWENASDGTNGQTIKGTFSEENTAQIDVRFTDGFGESHHKSLAVAIKSPKTPSVSISSTPSDLSSVCQQDVIMFSATPVNGGNGPAYSWYLNDVLQTGPNSSTFQPTSLPSGTYEVYAGLTSNIPCATNDDSYATSNTISFTVEEKTIMEPVVSLYHPSGTVYDGCSATFQVIVEGESEGLTYTWFKGNSVVTSDLSEDVSGGNNLDNKLVINEYNGEQIRCEVSKDAFCYEQNVSSNTLAISTDTRPALSVAIEGVERQLCKDEEITLTANANMSGATYTWTDNNGNSRQGSSFTTIATSEEDLNGISVTASVKDPCGDDQQYFSASNNLAGVDFTIYDPDYPSVSQPHIIPYNTSTTLSASGALTGESYRWYTSSSGGSPLSSTTTPKLTSNTTYYVSKYVAAEGCEGQRKPFTVTINNYPVANAGVDKVVIPPNKEVTLVGSGTDTDPGSSLSYKWKKASGPAASNTTSSTKTITVTDLQVGTYVFQLTVTDNHGLTDTDEVTVTVQSPPTVSAGHNRTVVLPGSEVTIFGSASDPDGDIESVSWKQTSGSTANISPTNNTTTTVSNLKLGSYEFELTAIDNDNYSSSDKVNVYVRSRPIAYAGDDQTVVLGDGKVSLNGYGTDLVDNGYIRSYLWRYVSGPEGSGDEIFDNSGNAKTGLSNLKSGTYVLSLKVTDNHGLSDYDQVRITVLSPPIVIAGADQTVVHPDTEVTIRASAIDPDGEVDSIRWEQTSGSPAAISDLANTTTTISDLELGSYEFKLTAIDNEGYSSSDKVNVYVRSRPIALAGADQTVVLGDGKVSLDGNGTDEVDNGWIEAYSWSLVSRPDGSTDDIFDNNEMANTGLSNLQAGTYVLRLTVSDNYDLTASDELTITVLSRPSVIAGADQTIILPDVSEFTLSGSASDVDGVIDSVRWGKVSGPTASITDSENATTTVTDLAAGTYVFSLTATDNHVLTSSDQVRVIVQSRPTVFAGDDQRVVVPSSQTRLEGTVEDDGNIVSYEWTQVSSSNGLTGAIANNNELATLLSQLEIGTYVFHLAVTDNDALSASDEVTIEVSLPANNYNYITTTSPQVKNIKDLEELESRSVKDKSISTTYFDGLGRPMQRVSWQASPAKKDIVQPVQYDDFGREARKYLPYVAAENEGEYYPDAVSDIHNYHSSDQYNFYQDAAKIAHDTRPFAQILFEASPLNRVNEQAPPGSDWQPGSGNTIRMAHKANDVTDRVINWRYAHEEGGFGKLLADGYYPSGQLYLSETVNEDEQLVREYTDKQGRVVLKDVRDEEDKAHLTYYVYDDFGNLRAVLQPAFMEAWKQAGGEVVDTIDYPGYQIVTEDKTIYDLSEGTKFYLRRRGSLSMGMDWNSGHDFHIAWEGELEPVASSVLNDFVFYYHYDQRQRMVEKHVPGGGITYMVYDQWDRLVLSQDEEQREESQWVYTKYDQLNRPVITGLWEDAAGRSREELQMDVNTVSAHYEVRMNSAFHGYSTNQSFPQAVEDHQVLTVTFYDDYAFNFLAEDTDGNYAYVQPEIKNADGDFVFEEIAFDRVKGQLTGSKTKVLGQNEWLHTVSYYDHKYRPVQLISQNNQGGIDRQSNAYDFVGKITHSLQQHQGVQQLSILKEYSYDHAGRLEQSWQTIAEGANAFQQEDRVLLVQNEYNALGELIDKKLHSQGDESFKQSVDYRYNIRGWLTSINNSSLSVDDNNDEDDDFFGMELGYTHDLGLGAPKVNHNGNITAIQWSSNLGMDTDENQRAYTYTYDGLNRIKKADYHKHGGLWSAETAFAVSDLEYDKNGNIKKLFRNGAEGQPMDQLVYEYQSSGNRLMGVRDNSGVEEGFKDGNTSGNDYSYYKNGNLKEDKNKGISRINYNYLNLPEEIVFENGGEIIYTYDAAGIKLSQLVIKEDRSTKLTEYIAGMVYEDEKLQFIQHEEGRVVYNSEEEDPFEYQYHLKDHLGNVRTSFTSKEKVDEMTATLETAREEEEYSQFLNYEKVTKINAALFDHTDAGGATNFSQRLSGTAKEQLGLAKSLAVMPGDVVSAEVYAKYLDPDQSNWNAALADLMTSIATGAVGVVVDGAGVRGGDLPFVGLLSKGSQEGVKAYLNVVIVDKNFNFIDAGFTAVNAEAKENGSDVAHQHLTSQDFTITKPGYVYVWLSNENEEPVDVFFDDFSVTHQHSPVIQADDYYPFGLTFNSYVSGDKNKYLFQGQEHQDELGLDWIQFKWRNHDPAIGRFFNVDPLAEDYYYNSPYAFAENKVISFIELEGLEAYPGGEILMIRRQMEQSGASKQELAEYDRGVSDASSVAVGFSPLGPVQDVKDLGVAIGEGDGTGIVIGVAGFLPGGDLLKGARKGGKALDNAGDAAKASNKTQNGARFIADTDGKLIDTDATPQGSYTQPDGSRTDVLQQRDHYNKKTGENHGTSHTHETYSNTNPSTGETRTGVSRTDTHAPTYEEVQNILWGNAKKID